MGLMMSEGKFVGRDEIAMVPTPTATASWKPVPHSEVIDAVTDVVKAHDWQILDEQYGLARDGQRMFGMIRINKSSSMEWSRCPPASLPAKRQFFRMIAILRLRRSAGLLSMFNRESFRNFLSSASMFNA